MRRSSCCVVGQALYTVKDSAKSIAEGGRGRRPVILLLLSPNSDCIQLKPEIHFCDNEMSVYCTTVVVTNKSTQLLNAVLEDCNSSQCLDFRIGSRVSLQFQEHLQHPIRVVASPYLQLASDRDEGLQARNLHARERRAHTF